MDPRRQKAVMISVLAAVLLLLYEAFPEYRGVIVISAIAGLGISHIV